MDAAPDDEPKHQAHAVKAKSAGQQVGASCLIHATINPASVLVRSLATAVSWGIGAGACKINRNAKEGECFNNYIRDLRACGVVIADR